MTEAASWGWWKSGASKIYLNITSELQILKGFGKMCRKIR